MEYQPTYVTDLRSHMRDGFDYRGVFYIEDLRSGKSKLSLETTHSSRTINAVLRSKDGDRVFDLYIQRGIVKGGGESFITLCQELSWQEGLPSNSSVNESLVWVNTDGEELQKVRHILLVVLGYFNSIKKFYAKEIPSSRP